MCETMHDYHEDDLNVFEDKRASGEIAAVETEDQRSGNGSGLLVSDFFVRVGSC